MRLAIAGPTRDTVPAAFAVDLAQLYAQTRERGPWADVEVGLMVSTYIHVGREAILEQVVAAGFSHVLWIDTDMSVPPDAAIRLAHHNRPIVAINYRRREDPYTCTAHRDGQPVTTGPASTGLEAVDGVGFGLVLLETAITAGLPRPWFRHGLSEAGRDIGEDFMFCRALRAAGQTVYIDHELSKACGHIGQHTYRLTGAPAALTD